MSRLCQKLANGCKSLPTLGYVILLAIIVVGFFWPLLLAGQWIPSGGGDLVSFLWPLYRFTARSLLAGKLPLWNPHLYSGAPFIADNQSSAFYPINLVAFALFGEPTYEIMEGLVVLHIWLAGVNMYALARGLGMGRPAALLGGIAFCFSDLFVTHIGNLNLNATAAWLPLLMLFCHRALSPSATQDRGVRPARRNAGRAAAAGAVLAIAALAGHAQMLLFLTLAFGLYLLCQLAADRRWGWPYSSGTLGLAALIVMVGIGGAALTLLPALEMAGHTGRGHLTYEEAIRYSLPPKALIGMLVPGFFGRGPTNFWGSWDRVEVGYIGAVGLVLAIVGLVRTAGSRQPANRSRSPIRFFALLAPLALVLAMGGYTPLYRLLYRLVPPFDQIRAPARLILLMNLGLAVLAAYGFDQLLRGRRGRPAVAVGLAALVAACTLLALGLPAAQTVPPLDRVPQTTAGVIIASVLLGSAGLFLLLSRWTRWSAHLLLPLLAAELIVLGSTLEAEPNDPTLGFQHPDIVSFLKEDPALFRIESVAGSWQPDAALAHGLYDIGGVYNPLELAPYQAYRWGLGERGSPLYNLLGARYVLANKGEPPGDARLAPVYTANPDLDVYLNTAALPRALLVHQAQIVTDHAAAWEAIRAPGFDPAETVILEEGEPLAVDPGDGERRLYFARYDLNQVELVVQTPVDSYLVLSDVYYPGWRATVDGKPAELLRADYVFRAVPVPAGEHTVRLEFAPWTWRAGLWVSIITWIGLGIAAGVTLKSERDHTSGPD